MMAGATDDPARHPLVVAMRALLRALHDQHGRVVRRSLKDAAILAHEASRNGSLGEHDAAAENRQELEDKLEAVDSHGDGAESELQLLWDTAILSRESPEAHGMDVEELEDLVLAYLVAFPDVLADELVMNLFRQVQLGQNILHAEERHINVGAVLEQMKPCLERHKGTAARIAAECCAHLQTRSETLAAKLLVRMDLDGDGFVGEEEFRKTMVPAMALEVENLAISVGVQQLLKEENFADDFHQAVCDVLVEEGQVQVS